VPRSGGAVCSTSARSALLIQKSGVAEQKSGVAEQKSGVAEQKSNCAIPYPGEVSISAQMDEAIAAKVQ
jgi:hypothetical protein